MRYLIQVHKCCEEISGRATWRLSGSSIGSGANLTLSGKAEDCDQSHLPMRVDVSKQRVSPRLPRPASADLSACASRPKYVLQPDKKALLFGYFPAAIKDASNTQAPQSSSLNSENLSSRLC
jgi:hypothetical protein